jgi:hypothetical protein
MANNKPTLTLNDTRSLVFDDNEQDALLQVLGAIKRHSAAKQDDSENLIEQSAYAALAEKCQASIDRLHREGEKQPEGIEITTQTYRFWNRALILFSTIADEWEEWLVEQYAAGDGGIIPAPEVAERWRRQGRAEARGVRDAAWKLSKGKLR